MKDLQTYRLATFVHTPHDKAIATTRDQLKKHLLDSVASLLFATDKPVIKKLIRQIRQMGEGGPCWAPVIGKTAPDRAAQLFTALIRYPDFMDNFLGKEATCHPSDNIGALLAAGQLANSTGKEFLEAMALGYEIECRLVEEIPVMIKGFDHTLLLAYSLTAALCKMLSLTIDQTAHALAIAGCSISPLVTSRASYTYEWKGLASSQVASACMNIVLLAKEGMTGPIALFEGPKNFDEVYGMKLEYDWEKEDFSLIHKCILKTFNAEVHTQPALEATLELKKEHGFTAADIETIDVTTFLTAYHIVGCGAYGDRTNVHSKEQADHSMPYLIAVALLDNEVYPEQLLPERINRSDVQELLQKVKVHTASKLHKPMLLAGLLDPYTEAYPEKVPSKVEIKLKNGNTIESKKDDYHGFYTRPLSWHDVELKFNKLVKNIPVKKQQKIISAIDNIEMLKVADLIGLLTDCLQETVEQ